MSDSLIGLSVPSQRKGDAKMDAFLNSLTALSEKISRLETQVTAMKTKQEACCDEMIKEHDVHIDTLRQDAVGHKHLNQTIAEFISMQKEVNKSNSERIQKLMVFQATITTIFTAISIIAGFFGDQIMTIVSAGFGGGK